MLLTLLFLSPASPAEETPKSPVVKVTVIQKNAARLDWSAARDLIAFDRKGPDGKYDVFTMRPDGSDVRCVTCDRQDLPNRHIGNPAWHPSGKYLLVQAEKPQHRRTRLARVTTPGAGVYNDLWLLDMESGKSVLLRETPNAPGNGTLHPHFSRDGMRLSWTEMKEHGRLRTGELLGLWKLMTADFRVVNGEPKLINDQAFEPCGSAFYENHGFSPDGTRLIYTSGCNTNSPLLNNIYSLHLATRKDLKLTDGRHNEHAIYSPDGRHIVWMTNARNENGGTDYWIMRSDGSGKRRLTGFNLKGHPHHVGRKIVVADFAWDPRGSRFAGKYVEGRGAESPGDTQQIVMIELDPSLFP